MRIYTLGPCAPNKFAYIGPRKSSIERAPSTIVNELEKVIQDLETRANKTDDAARLSVSRGDRFGELVLKSGSDSEVTVKRSLVSVFGGVVNWTDFSRIRYAHLEDLNMVGEWVVE